MAIRDNFDKVRAEFFEELGSKNGWGRNEANALLERCVGFLSTAEESFFEDFKKNFAQALTAKTGWGKNEIGSLFDRVAAETAMDHLGKVTDEEEEPPKPRKKRYGIAAPLDEEEETIKSPAPKVKATTVKSPAPKAKTDSIKKPGSNSTPPWDQEKK